MSRKLADTASGGQEVLLYLQARRFFCGNDACVKATFAEQVPGLAVRYGRERTCGLDGVLQAVALALGGRAGARLTGRLACAVGMIHGVRLIRAAPDPAGGTVLVLGVDGFALRKGHVYGTVLVDIQTRRPVDMLPERSAESFRAWLDAHPGAEIMPGPRRLLRRRHWRHAAGHQVADQVASVAQRVAIRACRHPPPLLPAGTTSATRPWASGGGGRGDSGDGPGRADPGPPRRGLRRAGPRADHHRGQPHLTAGTQDRAPLRHRRHPGPADLRPPPNPAWAARPAPGLPAPPLGRRAAAAPISCIRNCTNAATAAACAPCAGSPRSSATTPPSPRRHQRPQPGKWPAGS